MEKRIKKRLRYSEIDLNIDGKSYPMYNLSVSGFGFFADDPSEFKIGDILSPITLTCEEGDETVTGKIVHVTSLAKEKEDSIDKWVVGLKFLFSEDDREYYLKQFGKIMKDIG